MGCLITFYGNNLKIQESLYVLHRPVLLQNYAFRVSPMSKENYYFIATFMRQCQRTKEWQVKNHTLIYVAKNECDVCCTCGKMPKLKK